MTKKNSWRSLIRAGIYVICIGFVFYYWQPSASVYNVHINRYNILQTLYRNSILEREEFDKFNFSLSNKTKDHYFSIELPEPGVTELSCLTKSFIHRWHQLHPKTLFYLYIVGHDRFKIPDTFPNLRVRELVSSLITQTPLKWWLDEHVHWKFRTAMQTTITFDRLNMSYNPSDHPIPIFKHLKLIYSIVLLWHYGGTYLSTDIALIKPITTGLANATVSLVQRNSSRMSLDFLSVLAIHHPLINEFLQKLSNAYQNQDIMKLNEEFILSRLVKFSLVPKRSIHLLSANTFYGFDKEAVFSSWSTRNDSSKQWALWHNDKHRYGIHFPITRVPKYQSAPIKDSLIDRLISLPADLMTSKQVSCFHPSTERIHMGQLVYQHIHHYANNGDYVQAWASLQYYPCVDRFFERDNLHNLPALRPMQFGQSTFRNDSLTPILIVMNAWWISCYLKSNQQRCWPPPDHFRPIYISMHINHKFSPVMMTSRRTYDQYGPVGARDIATLQLMKQHNISAWFSGCLTTTLKWQSLIQFNKVTHKSIRVVDVHRKLIKRLVPPDILRNNVTWSTAIYRPRTINQTNEQLDAFSQVRKRFRTLLSSKLVLTSRLHVLIPCLAFNIPVMFIYHSQAFHRDRRLRGLVNFLVDHVYSEKDRYFWKNASHPHFVNWKNPTSLNKNKRKVLTAMISGLHQRLKQETELRVWGHFYRVFN